MSKYTSAATSKVATGREEAAADSLQPAQPVVPLLDLTEALNSRWRRPVGRLRIGRGVMSDN
jgi:hypothetical protein